MTGPYSLPESLTVAGKQRPIHPDFRDVLGVLAALENPELPPEGRLYLALRLFYPGFKSFPRSCHREALTALTVFLSGGRPDEGPPGPKLFDWQQDAPLIIADVNRVAGCEVRSLPFCHWWTFLSWFSAIGEGRLSAVVGIRQKLAQGRPLEDWERDWARQNPQIIRLKSSLSPEEEAEKARLSRLLETGKEVTHAN